MCRTKRSVTCHVTWHPCSLCRRDGKVHRVKACSRVEGEGLPTIWLTAAAHYFYTCGFMVKSSIQTSWSQKIISWSLFFQTEPFCQCNHIFLYQAQKQLYIYPSDWLNDILIELKFKIGRGKTHQGSVLEVATSNMGGTLEDRCSMFTSAWDRKSQLYCICCLTCYQFTNTATNLKLPFPHFVDALNCITIFIILYYFDILLLLL